MDVMIERRIDDDQRMMMIEEVNDDRI